MTPSQLTIGHGLGGVAYWSSARAPRTLVTTAADAAGVGHLVPDDPPPTSVLRSCMYDIAEKVYGKVRKQRFHVRGLAEAGHFECVRVVTGDVRNTYQPLFAACIDKDWNVGVLWSEGSAIGGLRQAVDNERTYLSATDVSSIAVKAMKVWHCTLLKDDGGVWFVPGPLLDNYRAWALPLRSSGCNFQVAAFEIASDPDTVAHVLQSLSAEIAAGVTEISDDIMAAEGGMADRSIRVREQRAEAMLAKVKAYEGYTGATLTGLASAVDKVKQALAMSKLLAASV